MLFRHGDVLIKTTDDFKIEKGIKLKPVKVLHKGQNHDHYFSKGKVMVGEIGDQRVIRILQKATISHGRGNSSEHASKILPKGDYWVEIQTEYDHLTEESRKVID